MKKLLLFFLVCGGLFIGSCSRDQLDPPEDCENEVTYAADIRTIVNNSCAYAGCHLNGAAPGDFSTYAGMQAFMDNDELKRRTLEIKNMPPNYAPAGRPMSLTDEELELFNCWVQSDYKE